MKSIWHHGAWNRNFGDWVLFDSIQHHLCQAARRPLHFLPIDSQRTVYSEALINKLNKEAQILLIGGGGLIFNRPEDHSQSGWQFNISLTDIYKIKVPIVIYGIGFNRFPYDPNLMPDILNDHLYTVQEQAALFSVRNTGTQNELIRRGLNPSKIKVVPDAGIFAPSSILPVPGLNSQRKTIGVNLAGDRPSHRYPGSTALPEEEELKCAQLLAQALREVVEKENAQVLFLPHILEVDESMRDIFTRELNDRFVCLHEACPTIYPPAAATASLLVGAYDLCDLIIGMRGHACLIAYGRGIPFLAMGSHAKNKFLLDHLGCQSSYLSTDAMLNGSLSKKQIIEIISKALNDLELQRLFKIIHEKDRVTFDDWNCQVAALL